MNAQNSSSDSNVTAAPIQSSGGGCPVKHDASSSSVGSSSPSPWKFWLKSSAATSTATTTTTAASMNIGGCPVVGGDAVSGSSSPPASIEESARHAQTPQPDQTIPLSIHRATSSIPKPNSNDNDSDASNTPSSTPAHQPSNASRWVYPSEQQFFNAMKRKGWELPPGTELTIPHVVQIHNAVNERGWREILQWENLRGNDNPRLVKFIGRPKDLSPRARFYSSLWLRNEPFDRHDWYVDRGDGTGLRRYVIDFYNGKEDTAQSKTISGLMGANNGSRNGLPSMYLDVRPALDDADSVQDRMKMFLKDAFPGIYGLVGSGSSASAGAGASSGGNHSNK